jgi:hypothetical protein
MNINSASQVNPSGRSLAISLAIGKALVMTRLKPL